MTKILPYLLSLIVLVYYATSGVWEPLNTKGVITLSNKVVFANASLIADRQFLIEEFQSVMRACEVDYAITTFKFEQTEPIRTVDMKGARVSGATQSIDLPALKQYTANWRRILAELSTVFQDTIVTIYAEGEVQVALNGTIF